MYIIGTVGPNISDKSVLKGIIQSGVNVLRFNFSHGNEQEFAGILKNAREIKEDIEVIVDLSGSKVRISDNFEYMIMKRFIFVGTINMRRSRLM